jgi:2-polyprenyl-3-methyl-5-hydroxy-6-metoxy-1,4-benzoquinol methylase
MSIRKFWKEIRKTIRDPGRLRRTMIEKMPNVIHAGRRAVTTKVKGWDGEYFKKKFENTEAGRTSFAKEMDADRLFGTKSWKPPIKDKGPLWFTTPLYPEEKRLDIAAAGLDQPTRIEIARQAISILFDIFFAGYAHRDFHSQNLFWIDQQLILIDYECIEPYPEGKRSPFPLSYDITGEGLESPFKTGKMCYTYEKRQGVSLQGTLGIPVEQAIEEFRMELKNRLREACLTFATGQTRHTCKAERIYSSFELPYFRVTPDEAQRDSSIRFKDFGITEENIRGKSVIDFGSNAGGMLFALQKYNPAQCLGIEYDSDKVLIAQQMAAYNGLNNVRFIQGDIDQTGVQDLGGPHNVVFCLAVEAHVKNPKKLFELLSQVTTEVLFFEGNSTTNPQKAKKALIEVGFRDARILGTSRDDVVPSNNCRPLLVAAK